MKVRFLLMMTISGDFLGVSGVHKISLALDYFSLRNTTNVNVLLCDEDVKRAFTSQHKANIFMNVKISKLVRQDVLTYVFLAQPLPTGVIVDLDCRRSWNVLQMVRYGAQDWKQAP